MNRKIGILRFLGTNCDRDVWQAIEATGGRPQWLWFEDHFEPSEFDAFILPGGFSYGDYLRCGALAARSPVMTSLRRAVHEGYPVLGICNGFQILCEAQLLPGALIRNRGLRFIDDWVELKIENPAKAFALKAHHGEPSRTCRLPIAHADGCYFVAPEEHRRIEGEGQVFCRYVSNPNGSVADIAGVLNASKNVAGLMPHPERALFDWMGGMDGLSIFQDLCGGGR